MRFIKMILIICALVMGGCSTVDDNSVVETTTTEITTESSLETTTEFETTETTIDTEVTTESEEITESETTAETEVVEDIESETVVENNSKVITVSETTTLSEITSVSDTTVSETITILETTTESETTIEDVIEPVEETTYEFVGTYTRGTYYNFGKTGGSGRKLTNGYSIASASLYKKYGYKDSNGNPHTFYIESASYPQINGVYQLDDSSALSGSMQVIDFWFNGNSNVPSWFKKVGVIQDLQVYLVN